MSNEIRIRLDSASVGQNLSEYLMRAGHPLHADCGGRGTCGKCRVKLVSGYLYANAACTQLAVPDQDGCVLACRTWCSEGTIIALEAFQGDGLTDFADREHATDTKEADATLGAALGAAPGIALDIGTTTLAAALVDTADGRVLATASALNPQASFGADVISRIEAIMRRPEALAQMQELLLDSVRSMLSQLLQGKHVKHMAVAGNPTMLHIFAGISPVGMGQYPFTPAFTESKTFAGEQFNLPVQSVTLLPSISAFVGGDITAGMLQGRLTEAEQPTLLIDVGTNGELVLFTGKRHGNRLYAASAAAGPAMEGAGISTGMGGIAGAVSAVRMQAGRPVCSTVSDAPAGGICGSGLVDLVALLYENDLIDDTGAFEHGDAFIYATTQSGRPLALTQADLRALQLSKSAIRAAIEALCAHADLTPDRLDRVYIAGGLGHYMNVESAVSIGLLPHAFKGRTQSLGNAALGGCVRILTDPGLIDPLQHDAARTQTLELSTDEVWNEAFMEHMMFPEKQSK